MTLGCLCRWDFTTAFGMVFFDVLQQSFKDRFQKSGAKVKCDCAVFLRSANFFPFFLLFSSEKSEKCSFFLF